MQDGRTSPKHSKISHDTSAGDPWENSQATSTSGTRTRFPRVWYEYESSFSEHRFLTGVEVHIESWRGQVCL